MPNHLTDATDTALLNDFQRDFPVVARPFAVVGERLGISEAETITRLNRLIEQGFVTRIGGVARPNTVAASTLAAVAAPEFRIDRTADIISEAPGVNHCYLREHDWNLWFVVTGPDRAFVDRTLKQISAQAALPVLDLPLERPYHIDLGFPLDGQTRKPAENHATTEPVCLEPCDRPIIQHLTSGLALTARPYQALGAALGLTEAKILERVASLLATGVVPRIGVIVRHRALGWRANAMVVWDVPPAFVDAAGARLAAVPAVNLCYRRRWVEGLWPYNLYCMIHGKTRGETLAHIAEASRIAGLDGRPRQILFSCRCYKQTGALVMDGRAAA